MAGIYIPDMKMPSQAESCIFYQDVPFRPPYCAINKFCKGVERCPLVLVPDHGRCIDADAMMKLLPPLYQSVIDALNNAPTIIPADKGEP